MEKEVKLPCVPKSLHYITRQGNRDDLGLKGDNSRSRLFRGERVKSEWDAGHRPCR